MPIKALNFQALLGKRDRALTLTIALTSGILMGLTPAPFNLYLLAWVALAPLWVLIVQPPPAPPSRLPACSLLPPLIWGIAYHGMSLAWITGLHPLTWLGMSWVASVAIVFFAWAFITLWGAALVCIWAASLSWLTRWGITPKLRVLCGTAIWCGLESLWAMGPLTWTSLSYTQSPYNLAILHLGQISGPILVTGAIVAINGLIAEAWVRQRPTFKAFASSLVLPGCLLLSLHLLGFSLYSRPLAQPAETALKVGIIQGNVPTRIKLFSDGLRRALAGYSNGYETLADQGVDVVLTPEGALPFQWQGLNRTQNIVYQSILEKGVPAWIGTFVPEGNRFTQSLLTIAPTGETLSRYSKVKLVPLGEYTPFQEVLGKVFDRLSPVKADLMPGDPNQRFDTPFGRGAVGICYESAFPELFRNQVADGAQFILTASNLDPYSTTLMAQHEAQDLMRSIETDRWSVRATNTGYSSVIDPQGRVVWRSQPNQYEIHAETIYRRQSQTLYVKWGNWVTPLLLGVAAIGWVIQSLKLKRGG
ncbi:MAG: apolipoprotein N-acyltransferase [Leptolyngbyaceae cyanobacterium CSU_1_3]|nr:apolipoprotein N-acyltransferase [Leptolyngbyaceae cyanobacterium CSU_1_3]